MYRFPQSNLNFLIIEMQRISGIHQNKAKILDKYIHKLITSYEESEKADIKLFTATQVSTLGLFADQGFIFRDSQESIRSSLITGKEKEKETQWATNKDSEAYFSRKEIVKTLEMGGENQ